MPQSLGLPSRESMDGHIHAWRRQGDRIIDAERLLVEGEAKCFVVIGSCAELAQVRDAKVQAVEAQMKEEDMVRAIEGVQSPLMEDWSDDYANSDHWLKYWNAVGAPSDDSWPEGLTEDGDKLFLKDKPLVPEDRVEDLIDYWHNAHSIHPGRDKLQKDLVSRFLFPLGYYAVLNRYCKACAVCRATKHHNRSTARDPVYTAIPGSPIRSISLNVFAMPEVTVEGEVFDCVILAVDRHRGYIVAVPGKKSKKKDKKDKHGVGLQAKTVAQAMLWHWLMVFDVSAMVCGDRGTQLVGAWFHTMCKYMGMRHAKTVAYHSRSNRKEEAAGRQLFEGFRQLHIAEPGRNWYHSLWRVLQAYDDLPGPSGLSPHCILFLRDRVSRTLPWMNHGNVAREANAMTSQADDTAEKVCDAMVAEHAKRSEYFQSGEVHKYRLKDTVWAERQHKDVYSRHRQQSWYIPGVILWRTGQDVYVIQVGNNKTLERDHTQLLPRDSEPHGRVVSLEFTADVLNSDNDGEEDEYTAECILSEKANPSTPGGRLYKVRWKGFAASRDSWEPPSSFVPQYTSVWLDYIKAKKIKLDVQHVLVHLVIGDRD